MHSFVHILSYTYLFSIYPFYQYMFFGNRLLKTPNRFKLSQIPVGPPVQYKQSGSVNNIIIQWCKMIFTLSVYMISLQSFNNKTTMMTQYFYLHPNSPWRHPSVQTPTPFHQLLKSKISSALCLSLNLFAVNLQQNKLNQIQKSVIFKQNCKSDNKASRKSSETLDASQKYIMAFQKDEQKLKQNKSKNQNQKTRKYSTFTNLMPIQSQDIQAVNSIQKDHTFPIILSSKKVPRKIRHCFAKSYKAKSSRPRIEQKLKKIKKVTLINTAEIKGLMSPLQRLQKMVSLLQRKVKCWNGSRQQCWIKNRQFRMLIRHA